MTMSNTKGNLIEPKYRHVWAGLEPLVVTHETVALLWTLPSSSQLLPLACRHQAGAAIFDLHQPLYLFVIASS